MAIETSIERQLREMEKDRDELLERLNQHECAGPADATLAVQVEEALSLITAIREDFAHLTTLAAGYEAQRDEARSDLESAMNRISGLEGRGIVPGPDTFVESVPLPTADPTAGFMAEKAKRELAREDTQESQTQTFAPGTVPMFQFDEMTRQRDTVRRELTATVEAYTELETALEATQGALRETTRQRDTLEHQLQTARNAGLAESESLKARIETLLGVCGTRLAEIETLEAVRDELRTAAGRMVTNTQAEFEGLKAQLDTAQSGASALRADLLTAKTDLDQALEQRDAAYQGSEPQSQEKIRNLKAVAASRESTISRLSRELEAERKNHAARRRALDSTREKLEAARNQRDEFKTQRDQVIHEKLLVVEDHEILTQRYDGAVATCDELREQFRLEENRSTHLTHSVAEAHEERDDFKAQVEGYATELAAAGVRIQHVAGERDRALNRVSDYQATCETGAQILEGVTGERNDFSGRLLATKAEVDSMRDHLRDEFEKRSIAEEQRDEYQRRCERLVGASIENASERDALGEQVTALQALKASDFAAIASWKEKADTAEERLDQAIRHIDVLTDTLTNDPNGPDTRKRIEIARKYMRDHAGESAPEARSDSPAPSPAAACVCGLASQCRCSRPTQQEQPEPPICFCADDGDGHPYGGRRCMYVSGDGAVEEEPDAGLDALAAGAAVRNLGTKTTWLAPDGACEAREDGLHVWSDSRHGPPICAGCAEPFTEETAPTATVPVSTEIIRDTVHIHYDNGGTQIWAPPSAPCTAPVPTHSPTTLELGKVGLGPVCRHCQETYTMNRVEWRQDCHCGGDYKGHMAGSVDYCTRVVAE